MDIKKMIEEFRTAGMKPEAIRSTLLNSFEAVKVDEAMREAFPAFTHVEKTVVDTRASEIVDICSIAGVDITRASAFISAGKTVEQVRAEIIAERAKSPSIAQPAKVTIDVDGRDKLRSQLSGALCLRAGVAPAKIAGGVVEAERVNASGARSMSMSDMARNCLEANGESTRMLDKETIIKRALGSATGDFTNVLGASVNKVALTTYEEAPATYSQWCGRGVLSDFKTTNIVQLSGLTALPEILPGEAPKQLPMSDSKETVKLKTLGGIFTLDRQAFYNDDLGAFDMLRKSMNAAKRAVNKLAYGALSDTMVDGGALFNATAVTTTGGHANLGSVAAISATTVTEMVKLLSLQKDAKGNALNIRGKFFLCSVTKEGIARQYMTLLQGGFVTDTAASANPWRGMYELITDAEIDLQLATTSYLLTADPNLVDTVKVFFRDGIDAPSITESVNTVGQPLGISWQILLDVAAKACDWRGMVKNVGA